MGHRIESLNLDLMNALPLPQHCPQDLWILKQGERKTWTIAFVDINTPGEFEETIHKVAGVPMIRMPQTVYQPKETATFEVLAAAPTVEVTDSEGKLQKVTVKSKSGHVKEVSCMLPSVGLYTVKVTDGDKQSQGVLSAHASWEWTMERAREGALKILQKVTSHIESWYGFHSSFIAARYFPEKQLDEALRSRFDYLFGLLHDRTKMVPLYHASRIQNTSGTIGLLVDKYEAYGDVEDLKKASRLADWLMNTWQRKDGAYVNHNTVYTSVIYVAKSMLELTLVERELGKTESVWKEAADRHYASAKRAIDQLVASQGDFETEGELTFEDGMVSCAALQSCMLALMQQDEKEKMEQSTSSILTLPHEEQTYEGYTIWIFDENIF